MKNILKRIMSYCLGLLLLAFGVTFSIRSNLGVSPVNSIPYVLSILHGIDQGLITTFVFCCYILIQAIILRREFKPINLLQIVFSSIFGYFVTFSNHLWVFLPTPQNYIIKLIFLCISMVFVSFGLMFYLVADIVPQPAEGVVLAIHVKTGIEFSKLKVAFDTTVVIIAVLISFIGFGELRGLREGTLIASLCIGKILGILNKRYQKSISDFIHNM